MDGRKLRKFNRICNELAEFMREVHTENEDIYLYVAGESDTFAMLIDTDGEDIGSNHWRRNQDKCVLSEVEIPYADCGGI